MAQDNPFADLIPAGDNPFADLVPAKPKVPLYGDRPEDTLTRPVRDRARMSRAMSAGSIMSPAAETTLGEDIDDAALAIREGARNVTSATVGLPVNALNAVNNFGNMAVHALTGGLVDPDLFPMAAQPAAVRGIQESLALTNAADAEANASDLLLEQRARLQDADGFLGTAAMLADNPTALLDVGLQQVGQALNVVPGAGTGANIAAGALSAGGQNADQTAQMLRQQHPGLPEEEVARRAAETFTLSALGNAVLPDVITGGSTIERAIGGRAAGEAIPLPRAAATGFLGEAMQGGASEALDQFAINVPAGRPATEGLGASALLGALLEGPLGGAVGALDSVDQAGVQRSTQRSAATRESTENGQGQEQEARREDEVRGAAGRPGEAQAEVEGQEVGPGAGRPETARPLDGTETREQLLSEFASARTPDEEAAAAWRLAEFHSRSGERAAEPAADRAAGGPADGGAGAAQAAGPDLPRFPGLTPEQVEAEDRAREQVLSDPEKALADYAAIPGTDGGRIVNTDEAREIFPFYSESADARSRTAVAVHEPSSWVANETFRRRMEAPPADGREPLVFFTGGGTGSGKSTGPKRIPELAEAERSADTVVDGNLQSVGSAVKKIEAALNAPGGARRVYILYTFRDPVQSFVHGALPRAERADYGRTVPLNVHAGTHIGAAKTFFALREKYAGNPNVEIRAVWNDYDPEAGTSDVYYPNDEDIQAIAEMDQAALEQEMEDALDSRNAAGLVSPRVYAGSSRQSGRTADRPAEPVRGQPAAPAQEPAPEVTPPPALRSAEAPGPGAATEQLQAAVSERLGDADVVVVGAMADVPRTVLGRYGLRGNETDIEGFYDPDAGRSYVIEANLDPRYPAAERAIWVAAHEWAGHHGLRSLDPGNRTALATVLARAGNNPTVRAVADKMAGQRSDASIEEALAELAAAVRTGNFDEIQRRYGVTVSPDARTTLRGYFERLIAAIRRALNLSTEFSDHDLYRLIEDAHRAAQAHAGSTRPSRRPVASRPIPKNYPQGEINAREPWGKKGNDQRGDTPLAVNLAAAKAPANAKAYEKNVGIVATDPIMAGFTGDTDATADHFIQQVAGNLLFLHDAMDPALRDRAKQWYDGGQRLAQRFAQQYGVTPEQGAAAIATLSPQKDWYQNVSLAERVLDIVANHGSDPWTPAMAETMARIFPAEKYPLMGRHIEGKSFADIPADDRFYRGAWVRVFDQTYNSSDYDILSPEGDVIRTATTASGAKSRVAWGSNDEIGKAVSVATDGSPENISRNLGEQHKVRSFYNNLISPDSPNGYVTIDTHAVAAGLLRPLSGSSTEVAQNFGGAGSASNAQTGLSGTYFLYAEAYNRAAKARGILAREMQSITWESIRGLFRPRFKGNKSNVDAVYKMWENGGNVEEIRNAVVERAGGFEDPSWAEPGAGVDAEGRGAPDAAGVPAARVPAGRDRAGAAGRGRRGADPAGTPAQRNAARRRVAAQAEETREVGPVIASRRLAPTEPLPGAPKVRGATGPHPGLVAVAERYAADNNIDLHRQAEYVKADPERGARIAQAYADMEHAPDNPRVKAAYADLIRQTMAQYRALEEAGFSFWFMDPERDPYGGNPWNAMRDLRETDSMAVFPTDAGFGSAIDFDPSQNPLLADTGLQWPYGSPDGELRPVLANDLFRAVHDAFGHGLEGAGFRADGEENAWQAHVRLFTGPAVGAITSETRGQNSWLNFGPNGEANRAASVEDTVFADQKTGLMPPWTWREGRAGDMGAPLASRPAPTGTRNEVTDLEREAEGRDPIIRDMVRTNEQTVELARAAMAADPQLAAEIVSRAPDAPIGSVEEAVLLIEKARLRNRRDEAAKTLADPDVSENVRGMAARVFDIAEGKIADIDAANAARGTEWGRLGQFRQRMMAADFSLEAMEAKMRKATGGKLTPEMQERLRTLDSRIKKAEAAAAAAQKKLADFKARNTVQDAMSALMKQVQAETRKAATGGKSKMDLLKERADSARKRLQSTPVASRPLASRSATPAITASELVDLYQIGAYHVAAGASDLAGWIEAMRADLGATFAKLEPMWPDLYAASKTQADVVDKVYTKADPHARVLERVAANGATRADVRDLVMLRIRNGEKSVDAILAGVARDLSSVDPSVDVDVVRGLFLEHAEAISPTAASDRKSIQELRVILRLRDEIERLQAGGTRTRGSRPEQANEEIRQLRATLADALRRADQRDPELKAAIRDARVENLNAQIADLEDQIRTGRRPAKKDKPVVDAHVAALQERRDALVRERRRIDTPRPDPETRYQIQRGRSIAKQIERLQQRLKDGDYASSPRVPRALNKENTDAQFALEELRRQFNKARFNEELKRRSPARKVFDTASSAINLARAIMTSLDLSAYLRQGGFVAIGHPVRGIKGVPTMLKAFASEKFARESDLEISKRENAPLYKKYKLAITTDGTDGDLSKMEEAYMTRWLERIDYVDGQPVRNAARRAKNIALAPIRGSARAYTSFLNRIRADSFDAMVASLTTKGEMTDAEGKAIADYVNTATGRASVPFMTEQAAVGLNTVFFAPRLVASRFKLLIGQPLYGGSNRTRTMIASDYARFMTGVGVIYGLGWMAYVGSGQDEEDEEKGDRRPFIELDPRSSSFGRMRYGDWFVDPLAGLAQVTTFLTRFAGGDTKTAGGEIRPLRNDWRLNNGLYEAGKLLDKAGFEALADEFPQAPNYEKADPFGQSSAGVLGQFLRTKLAPVPGAIINTFTGENMIGQEVTPAQAALDLVTPMTIGNIGDAIKDRGVPAAAALTMAEVLGMAVQYRDRSAMEAPDYNNLSYDQKREYSDYLLKVGNLKQDVNELYELANSFPPDTPSKDIVDAVKMKADALGIDGVSVAQFARNTRVRDASGRRRSGDVKRTQSGGVQLKFSDGSTVSAMRDTEKSIGKLNDAIEDVLSLPLTDEQIDAAYSAYVAGAEANGDRAVAAKAMAGERSRLIQYMMSVFRESEGDGQ